MKLMKDTIIINVVNCMKIVRIKTKSFNQIWIIDLKATEMTSKEAFEEDEHDESIQIWLTFV